MKRMVVAALMASASALGLAACSNDPVAQLVGAQVDNFQLVDQTGMAHALKYDTITPAVVLVTNVVGDEGARAAAKAAQALAEKHPNIVFKLLNSSPVDTRETIAAEAKELGLTLPVLDDEFQLIGDSLGVTYAGEAVVVDTKTWKVAYRGPAVD
jgi:ABC-type glycerol-3-phosphate transport system substrate-binding protein